MNNVTSTTDLIPDDRWLRRFRSRLLDWYRNNARALPWKENISPYRVWISEIMLQQTQVGTVLDAYFERFVETLPTVFALAEADEQTVLQLWEGLGYYSRARNLHKAARILVEQYNGAFPQDVNQVQKLPGIGRYTAGAILSISMNLPTPILEANTVRIHTRLLGIEADPSGKAIQNTLWAMAQVVLPTGKNDKPGEFNQALMQFGQQVCKKAPDCLNCCVSDLCRAFTEGRQAVIPAQKVKESPLYCDHVAVVIRDTKNRIFLRQNGPEERWSGLWDFARFEVEPRIEVPSLVPAPLETPSLFATDDAAEEAAGGTAGGTARLDSRSSGTDEADEVAARLDSRGWGLDGTESLRQAWRQNLREQIRNRFQITIKPESIDELTTIRHSVTKYRITLHVYEAKTSRFRAARAPSEAWIVPSELENYPLSSTGRKIAQRLIQSAQDNQ